jgi:hypothetical protein
MVFFNGWFEKGLFLAFSFVRRLSMGASAHLDHLEELPVGTFVCRLKLFTVPLHYGVHVDPYTSYVGTLCTTHTTESLNLSARPANSNDTIGVAAAARFLR